MTVTSIGGYETAHLITLENNALAQESAKT